MFSYFRDRRERQSQPTANNTTNSVQGGMVSIKQLINSYHIDIFKQPIFENESIFIE